MKACQDENIVPLLVVFVFVLVGVFGYSKGAIWWSQRQGNINEEEVEMLTEEVWLLWRNGRGSTHSSHPELV